MNREKIKLISGVILASAHLEESQIEFNNAWNKEKSEVLETLRSRKVYKQNFNYYLDNYKEAQLVDYIANEKKSAIGMETQIGDIKKMVYELNGFPRYLQDRKINLDFISELKTEEELMSVKEEIEDLVFNVYRFLEDDRNEVRKGTRATINSVIFEALACIDVDTTKNLKEVSRFSGVGEKAPTRTIKERGKRALPRDVQVEKGIFSWVKKRYEEALSEVIFKETSKAEAGEELTITLKHNEEENFVEDTADNIFSNYIENKDYYRESCGTGLQVINKYYKGSDKNIKDVCKEYVESVVVVDKNVNQQV